MLFWACAEDSMLPSMQMPGAVPLPRMETQCFLERWKPLQMFKIPKVNERTDTTGPQRRDC